MKQKKRIEYIDVCRGIVILLVMFRHSMCMRSPYLAAYMQSFYMPLFFVFSGYFRRDNPGVMATVKKSFKSLYVPYLCWLVLILAFYGALQYHWGSFKAINYGKALAKGVLGIRQPSLAAQFWFIMTLFTLQIGYAVMDRCVKSFRVRVAVVFILTLCGLGMNYVGIKQTPFRIETAMIVLPIFCFGILLKKDRPNWLELSKLQIFLLLCLHIGTGLGNYFLNNRRAISLWSERYDNYALFYVNAMLGAVVWMNIVKRLDQIENRALEKVFSALRFFGRNSFVALLDMNLVIYILNRYPLYRIPFIHQNVWTQRYVCFLLTVLLQIPIIKILQHKKLRFLVGR